MTEFKKIDEFVQKHNILPRDCLYHTWRALKDSSGKETGKLRVLAWKDNIARSEYICPECTKYGYQETPWKRPFSVKCQCGFRITVPKMKAEFKKEQKAKK
ncbi:MAG: hypothetical protein HZB67_05200 [Candidatus Aenigmarchaeota archaeon]|nr:hypothetical protein [Candidatus Aenigmarchaeota archaeon]